MSEALPCGPIGSMRLADGPTGRSLGLPNSFGERAHAAATVPMFAMNRRRENKVDIEVAPQLSSVAGGRRPCHLLLLPASRYFRLLMFSGLAKSESGSGRLYSIDS